MYNRYMYVFILCHCRLNIVRQKTTNEGKMEREAESEKEPSSNSFRTSRCSEA